MLHKIVTGYGVPQQPQGDNAATGITAFFTEGDDYAV
jgi:hypothetical protein